MSVYQHDGATIMDFTVYNPDGLDFCSRCAHLIGALFDRCHCPQRCECGAWDCHLAYLHRGQSDMTLD